MTTKEQIGLMMTGSLDLSKTSGKTYGIAKDSLLTDEEWQKLYSEESKNE